MDDQNFEVVIVGAGFAGGAMATVLARAGRHVLVLEKSTVYRDLVRGEWIAPWGVVEARNLGLYETLIAAGGHHVARHIEYGEDIDPAEATAEGGLDMTAFLPGIQGPLCIGHPAACEALAESAVTAGATFLRGVDDVIVEPGDAPSVRFRHDGDVRAVTPKLVVAADGRNSAVRGQLGLTLHRDTPHHWFSGLLVDGVPGWPEDVQTMGSEGDVQFFVFPQGGGRLRLYLSYPLEQKSRLAGEASERAFLDAFASLSLPHSLAGAQVAGPCRSVPNEDTWVDRLALPGVVFVGDAGGWNDPIIGQGLSIALRDVRIVSDLLLSSEAWTGALFRPYEEERAERMRRLRFAAQMDSIMHAEFGPEARKRRAALRARRAADPSFLLALAGVMIGPELLPPDAFDESVREAVLAAS